MKLLAHLLIVVIVFTSCTGYKYSVIASKEEPITLQKLDPIKPGDKLNTVSRSGLRKRGRLISIDDTSLKMSLNSNPANSTYELNLDNIKRIKFEEDKGKTVANVVAGSFLAIGIFLIWVANQFEKHGI